MNSYRHISSQIEGTHIIKIVRLKIIVQLSDEKGTKQDA
jgi:hypothetical protein